MLYLPRVLAVTFARGDPGATSSRTSGPTVPFSPVPIYGFRPLANLHALLIEAPLKMNIWQRFKGLSSIILCWAMIQVLLVKKVHNCKIFRTPPPKTPTTYNGSYLLGGVGLIGCRWQTFLPYGHHILFLQQPPPTGSCTCSPTDTTMWCRCPPFERNSCISNDVKNNPRVS